MKKILPKDRLWSVSVSLWWILIWTLSSLPSESLPPVGEWGVDKIAHLFVYTVLAILINQAIQSKKFDLRTANKFYLVLLISAMLDESHQVFVPGRSVSIYDFAANASGLAIGYGIMRWQFWSKGSRGI